MRFDVTGLKEKVILRIDRTFIKMGYQANRDFRFNSFGEKIELTIQNEQLEKEVKAIIKLKGCVLD